MIIATRLNKSQIAPQDRSPITIHCPNYPQLSTKRKKRNEKEKKGRWNDQTRLDTGCTQTMPHEDDGT